MKCIWKYQFVHAAAGQEDIDMPIGAEVLSVGEQDIPSKGTLVLWALVNPEAHLTKYRFLKVETCQPVPENAGRYLGTVQLHGLWDENYRRVLHVYQKRLVETFAGEHKEV
jgi:hypothetical protein